MVDINDIEQDVFIEKLGKFEDITKLANMPEFDTLKFYFNMVADQALKRLVMKPDLTVEEQAELKAIIKICKYEFVAMPVWLNSQAALAREELEFRREHGILNLKDKT